MWETALEAVHARARCSDGDEEMLLSYQSRVFVGIIIGVAVLAALIYAHGEYVDECVKSGHTERWCQFEFWK